jgi:hypothetical protein
MNYISCAIACVYQFFGEVLVLWKLSAAAAVRISMHSLALLYLWILCLTCSTSVGGVAVVPAPVIYLIIRKDIIL